MECPIFLQYVQMVEDLVGLVGGGCIVYRKSCWGATDNSVCDSVDCWVVTAGLLAIELLIANSSFSAFRFSFRKANLSLLVNVLLVSELESSELEESEELEGSGLVVTT